MKQVLKNIGLDISHKFNVAVLNTKMIFSSAPHTIGTLAFMGVVMNNSLKEGYPLETMIAPAVFTVCAVALAAVLDRNNKINKATGFLCGVKDVLKEKKQEAKIGYHRKKLELLGAASPA